MMMTANLFGTAQDLFKNVICLRLILSDDAQRDLNLLPAGIHSATLKTKGMRIDANILADIAKDIQSACLKRRLKLS
jgi:hypothetical protein